MTRRISPVAVCCSSASVRSRLRASSSWNRRTFSIAMTAWSAKVLRSSICLSVNGRTVRRMMMPPRATPSRSSGTKRMVRTRSLYRPSSTIAAEPAADGGAHVGTWTGRRLNIARPIGMSAGWHGAPAVASGQASAMISHQAKAIAFEQMDDAASEASHSRAAVRTIAPRTDSRPVDWRLRPRGLMAETSATGYPPPPCEASSPAARALPAPRRAARRRRRARPATNVGTPVMPYWRESSQSASTAALNVRFSSTSRAPSTDSPTLPGDLQEHLGPRDVARLDEVGAEQRVVDRLAAGLRVRPLAELLGQAAVVRHRALAVRQALRRPCAPSSARAWPGGRRCVPANRSASDAALRRRLRVEREVHPLDLHAVLSSELLNTHGTEIAPGSDVVGEDLHRHWLGHAASLSVSWNWRSTSRCPSGKRRPRVAGLGDDRRRAERLPRLHLLAPPLGPLAGESDAALERQ